MKKLTGKNINSLFVIGESQERIIIIVLSSIAVILFIYLVYLFVRKNNKKVLEKADKALEPDVLIDKEKTEVIPTISKRLITKIKDPEKNSLFIKYNYSFEARLILAPIESQERFSELKNYILSYENVTVNKSWKYERFSFKGKPLMKIWIHGQVMKIYYNLTPKDFYKTKYNIANVSYASIHETTPSLLKVSGNRGLEYAKELVDIYMRSISHKEQIEKIDYKPTYRSKEDLIAAGLIKMN